MKIDRFNENYGQYKPTDKILKVSVEDFKVLLKDIENTDAYQNALEHHIKEYPKDTIEEARQDSIMYGLEEYVYRSGNAIFNWKLYDGMDNKIEDEKDFDKYADNVNKYNV